MNNEFVYDENNIFNKIINKKVKSNIFKETNDYIVIFDIQPTNNTHLLFIPKQNIKNMDHMIRLNASEVTKFYYNLTQFLLSLKKHGINSYQLITNNGSASGQVVFHLHFHIVSCDFLNKVI